MVDRGGRFGDCGSGVGSLIFFGGLIMIYLR